MHVKIQNFQIIKDMEFDIEGITVISGLNNQGKSAIMRAIGAVCFGRSGDSFVRRGTAGCYVEIQDGGHTYVWCRSGNNIQFILDGHPYIKTGGKPPTEYVQSLKIHSIDLSRFSLTPNFDGEDDPRFVVGLSPVDAAACLSFLFSGEKFPLLLKKMAIAIKDEKDEAKRLEIEIDSIQAETDSMFSQLSEVERMAPWFEFRPHIDGIVSYLEEMSRHVDEIHSIREEINDCVMRLSNFHDWSAALSAVTVEKVNELEIINRGVADLGSLINERVILEVRAADLGRVLLALGEVPTQSIEEYKSLNRDVVDMEALNREIGSLDGNLALLKASQVMFESAKPEILPSVESLDKDLRELKSLTDEIEVLKWDLGNVLKVLPEVEKEINSVLAEIEVCPVCSSSLTEDARDHLLKHMV